MTGPSSRRWLQRTLICLVLGMATTVAVAWGASVIPRSARCGRGEYVLSPRDGGAWPLAWRNRVFAREMVEINFGLSRGSSTHPILGYEPWWARALHSRSYQSWPIGGYMGGFGWPRLAMWHVIDRDRRTWGRSPSGGILIRPGQSAFSFPIAFPYYIIPRGFAIDAGFFGSLWFVALFGVRDARLWLRVRRGLCPKCAYDLKGDFAGGCPECGWNRAGKGVGDSKRVESAPLPSPG